MRVTAAEVMQKKAAPPVPGANPRPAPTGRPRPAGPMAPPAPEDPQAGAPTDPAAAAAVPGAEDAAGASQSNDLQRLTQSLLNDYFDDQKINDASTKIQQLIPIVGPEHAEKFVKVYSDWVKAAMTMKANLLAMVVMATPQQMMQNQVQQMMKQLQMGAQPGGQQPLKVPVGPLT